MEYHEEVINRAGAERSGTASTGALAVYTHVCRMQLCVGFTSDVNCDFQHDLGDRMSSAKQSIISRQFCLIRLKRDGHQHMKGHLDGCQGSVSGGRK